MKKVNSNRKIMIKKNMVMKRESSMLRTND